MTGTKSHVPAMPVLESVNCQMKDSKNFMGKKIAGFRALVPRILVLVSFVFLIFGCGEKEPSLEDLIIGSWSRYQSRTHVVFSVRANGSWASNVRIEGHSSQIIEKKGDASGTWLIEDKNLVITIAESDLEDIWEQYKTLFYEVFEIDSNHMVLMHPEGRKISWKRLKIKKKGPDVQLPPVIHMEPIVVNLNKIRAHDKDRYFCLSLDLMLTESLTDIEQPVPTLHPRARDSAIIYLSSLIYRDVKTFDKVKVIRKQLEAIMAPYLDGRLKEIKLKQVVISSSLDKVDEFLIEHTPVPEAEPVPEEEGEDEKKEET